MKSPYIWSTPEECPHRFPSLCRNCDWGRIGDCYPDCPWRVTDADLKRDPRAQDGERDMPGPNGWWGGT